MKPLDCQKIYTDADFYNQEFADRTHEISFFLKHAQLRSGPILEVACGTGRITLPIARAGIAADGGVAGVHYGLTSIPQSWRSVLARHAEIQILFEKFAETTLS